jgi:hypothetical protein
MKERSQKPIGQKEKDDVLLDFVNYKAQEAIPSPDLPGTYKDEVLDAAIETIYEVAERRAAYFAKHGEGRKTRRPNILYEAK